MTTAYSSNGSNGSGDPHVQEVILPPHNIEAEEALLGAIFIDPDRFAEIDIEPEMFYENYTRQVYLAFKKLKEKKRAIDFVTVSDILRGKGIEDDGRLLGLMNATPTSVNIKSYADIVKADYYRRILIRLSGKVATKAYGDEDDIDAIVTMALEEIRRIGGESAENEPQSSYDISNQMLEVLSNRRSDKESADNAGLSYGFLDLDRLLQGSEEGDLLICAGRPGMGKSVFEQAIRMNVAEAGGQVAAFNLEMTKEQLMVRAIASRTQIAYKQIYHPYGLSEVQWQYVNKAIGEISQLKMYIDDSSRMTINQLEAKVHRLFAEYGHFDLITVDYLQLMNGTKAAKNRVQEIGEISRGLKALAKEMKTVVFATAQVNRAVESRPIKKPNLSDLRESGDIEQDANVVMLMYRDEYYNEETARPNITEIDIAKHRNGPTGQIDLYFNAAKMRFMNLTREPIDL